MFNGPMFSISTLVHSLYKAIKPDKLSKHGRYSIDTVHCNDKHLVVTNGHFMIVQDKPADMDSLNANVRPKSQSKESKHLPIESMGRTGDTLVSSFGSTLEISDHTYVDYQAVLPDMATGKVVTVGLNADYLRRISEYLESDEVRLDIKLSEDNTPQVIEITSRGRSDAFAILMPVKVF